MKVKTLTVGPLSTNCYIVYDGNWGIVIDPGDEGKRIFDVIQSLNIDVSHIILTHAHFDHMGAVDYIKDRTNAVIAIGEFENEGYKKQPPIFSFAQTPVNPPDINLSDGSVINSGNISLKVMHTPGHTVGGITLIGDSFAICGDTIFCESVGRTDLPGGNFNTELESIAKILELPGDTILHCGHGTSTTVSHEKKYNFYIKR